LLGHLKNLLSHADRAENLSLYRGRINILSLVILEFVLCAMIVVAIGVTAHQFQFGPEIDLRYWYFLLYLIGLLIALGYQASLFGYGLLCYMVLAMRGLYSHRAIANFIEGSEIDDAEIVNLRYFSILRLRIGKRRLSIPSFTGWFGETLELVQRDRRLRARMVCGHSLESMGVCNDVRAVAVTIFLSNTVLPVIAAAHLTFHDDWTMRQILPAAFGIIVVFLKFSLPVFCRCFMEYRYVRGEGLIRSLFRGSMDVVPVENCPMEFLSIVYRFHREPDVWNVYQYQMKLPLPVLELLLESKYRASNSV
jgi:hypothetical protein